MRDLIVSTGCVKKAPTYAQIGVQDRPNFVTESARRNLAGHDAGEGVGRNIIVAEELRIVLQHCEQKGVGGEGILLGVSMQTRRTLFEGWREAQEGHSPPNSGSISGRAHLEALVTVTQRTLLRESRSE
jgi:hypothetical protein